MERTSTDENILWRKKEEEKERMKSIKILVNVFKFSWSARFYLKTSNVERPAHNNYDAGASVVSQASGQL